MKPALRTVRLPSTEPLEKQRIGKTLLTGKKWDKSNNAESHGDPFNFRERMKHYERMAKETRDA